MKNMDHTEAVKLQAVEKYILGELTPPLRDEFEAHYFDCMECSLNLRSGVAFAAASRQYFAEAAAHAVVVPTPRRDWFAWLKPLVAVPVFAALLLIIGYQNLVTIPHLKQAGTAVAAVNPWFSLRASNVRGTGEKLKIRPGQAFSLFVDVTEVSKAPDSNFLLQLKDSSGKIMGTSSVSAAEARKPVSLYVPAGAHEGEYDIVIFEQAGSSIREASHLPFAIAFSVPFEQH